MFTLSCVSLIHNSFVVSPAVPLASVSASDTLPPAPSFSRVGPRFNLKLDRPVGEWASGSSKHVYDTR
jgi:hypothetical protein